MPRRIVNCYRGPKLVRSFIVTVDARPEQPDDDFVDEAKKLLVEKEIAQAPFSEINFVVRQMA